MSDPFPILIEVEEKRVGSILRQLDTMAGILRINLQLSNRKPTARLMPTEQAPTLTQQPQPAALPFQPHRVQGQRKPKSTAGSMRDIIIRALSQGALHKNLIGQVFARNGLSAASANSVLHTMVKEKVLVRVGPGTFRLSRSNAKPRRVGSGKIVDNTTGFRYLVLSQLAEVDLGQNHLMKLILERGYSRKNMYNMVPRMRQEGLIKKVNNIYSITERGREAMAPEPAADSYANEQTLLEHQEAIHGETD